MSPNLSDHDLVEVTLRYNPKNLKDIEVSSRPEWDPGTFRGRNMEIADYEAINKELNKIDWDKAISQCENDNNGDKNGNYFVDYLRQTVLDICINNSESKKYSKSNQGSKNKRTLIRRKKKINARYLALKAKNPSSDKIQKLENELFVIVT